MRKLTKSELSRWKKVLFHKYYSLIHNQDEVLYGKEDLQYWRNRVFYVILAVILFMGAPLISYGAYLFFQEGNVEYAISEIVIYMIIVGIEFSKRFSLRTKKHCLILVQYLISIFLLITTGVYGTGLIILMFTLILASCILDKKENRIFIIANLLVFIIMSILLYADILEGTPFNLYKEVWLINAVMAQGCGIIISALTTVFYSGLARQAQIIKQSQKTIRQNEEKLKAMIKNNSDAILIADESGRVTYHSPNLRTILPWTTEDMPKQPLFDWFHPEDREYFQDLFQNILIKKGSQNMELRYLHNGKVGYVEMTVVNLLEDMSINGILINCRDITERRLREEQIMYLYQHDPLTGLYNRASFEIELKRLDNKRYLPLSIVVGDINGLKMINDSLGHAEGDRLLLTMREILVSCCRKEDIIARLGGDEFTMLLPNTDRETALSIIQKIYQACDEYNRSSAGEIYQISISLGAETKTNMEEPISNINKIAEDYMYKRKLLEGRSYHSSVIASIKTALFEKSYETERHAHRLVDLTRAVGEAIGITRQQFDELELLSTLHDIGKIGVDNQILNKPGVLIEEEWKKMKKHSDIGYRIAMASPELMSIAYYILTHHEHWDGGGYPQGLSGERIPLLSRILAVADAYDAMTEDRPYRKAMTKEEALQEIKRNAGTQFDPKIAQIFIEIIGEDREDSNEKVPIDISENQ